MVAWEGILAYHLRHLHHTTLGRGAIYSVVKGGVRRVLSLIVGNYYESIINDCKVSTSKCVHGHFGKE